MSYDVVLDVPFKVLDLRDPGLEEGMQNNFLPESHTLSVSFP